MKKFFTSYYLTHDNGEKYKFGSHIFAIDQEEAEHFAYLRGLGEVIDGWSGDVNIVDGKFVHDILTVSDMFNRNFEPARVLHGMVWLANINKDIGQLGDLGLLHELTHFYSGTTQPYHKSKEELYRLIKDYEERTCGYLPEYCKLYREQ